MKTSKIRTVHKSHKEDRPDKIKHETMISCFKIYSYHTFSYIY